MDVYVDLLFRNLLDTKSFDVLFSLESVQMFNQALFVRSNILCQSEVNTFSGNIIERCRNNQSEVFSLSISAETQLSIQ